MEKEKTIKRTERAETQAETLDQSHANQSQSPEAFNMTPLSIRKWNKKNKRDLWAPVCFAYRN